MTAPPSAGFVERRAYNRGRIHATDTGVNLRFDRFGIDLTIEEAFDLGRRLLWAAVNRMEDAAMRPRSELKP